MSICFAPEHSWMYWMVDNAFLFDKIRVLHWKHDEQSQQNVFLPFLGKKTDGK